MKTNDLKNLIKKFQYSVGWSEEDDTFIAYAVEFPSVKAHASSDEKAISEVKKPLLEALKWELEEGHDIPEPISTRNLSGNLSLRLGKELHREVALKAAQDGQSINQYIKKKLTS